MQEDPFGDDIGGGINDDLVGGDNDQPFFNDTGFNDDLDFANDMQDYPGVNDMEEDPNPVEENFDLNQLNLEGQALR